MSIIDKLKNKIEQTVSEVGGTWDSTASRSDAMIIRMDHCKSCDEFIKLTQMCSKCGCFMKFKVQMKNAKCPLGKW